MQKMRTIPISELKRSYHKMYSDGPATRERRCAQRLIHDPYAPIVTPKLSNTLKMNKKVEMSDYCKLSVGTMETLKMVPASDESPPTVTLPEPDPTSL